MGEVHGPLFVSIGTAEMAKKFLSLNPSVPAQMMFVDDYSFSAYNAMKLEKITSQPPELVKDVKLKAPKLGGFKGWFSYLSNVMALSPIDKDKPGLPEGVTRLGATFVVKENDVVFQWNDRIPGDHPDPREVLSTAAALVTS